MIFFFKKKPIEITAFVSDAFAFVNEYTPIKPAKEFFPKWWKDVSSSQFDWESFQTKTTVKSCPGIISSLSTGFIMPMWSDLAIEYGKDNWKFQYSDQKSTLQQHTNKQMPGFYEDHWIFKLESPWQIRSPVNLMYQHPFYLHNTPFSFIQPYGMSTPNTNLHASNIFLFAKKEEGVNRVMIKNNTPLLHIIPLTENPVIFKTEVVNQQEYLKQLSIQSGVNSFASRALKTVFRKNNKL